VETIHITYRIECSPSDIDTRAEELLPEQTVQLRRECVHEKWVFENIIDKVENIVRTGQAEGIVNLTLNRQAAPLMRR